LVFAPNGDLGEHDPGALAQPGQQMNQVPGRIPGAFEVLPSKAITRRPQTILVRNHIHDPITWSSWSGANRPSRRRIVRRHLPREAQPRQHSGGSIGSPFADRGKRPRSGECGRDRDPQRRWHAVPHTPPLQRISHPFQHIQHIQQESEPSRPVPRPALPDRDSAGRHNRNRR
jgi:hypothetical protein